MAGLLGTFDAQHQDRSQYPNPSTNEWSHIRLHVGPASIAMPVRLIEGDMIERVPDERILDVAGWRFQTGTPLNILRSVASHPDETRHSRGERAGRSFVIEDDGTIAVSDHRHLVLGCDQERFDHMAA